MRRTTYHPDGTVTQDEVPDPVYTPEQVNEQTVRERAGQALATNRTFLAVASPTNAQVVAQVKALTRQMNGLVRLVLGQLDATE